MSAVTFHPNQTYAIENIVRAFGDGKDVVVFHGPTGSGKSLIAGEVARRLGYRTFTTTPQLSLVAQYASDPRFQMVAPEHVTMTGKRNYECLRDRIALDAMGRKGRPALDASEAVCFEIDADGSVAKNPETGSPIRCRYRIWGKDHPLPDCEYYRKKAEAELAPMVVSTLAYFMYGVSEDHAEDYAPVWGWMQGRLSSRPFLIVDEAHGLEAETIRYLTTRWTEEKYDSPAYEKAWEEWTQSPEASSIANLDKATDVLDEEYAKAVEGLVARLRAIIIGASETTEVREMRFVEQLERDVDLLASVPEDIRTGVPWVVKFYNRESRRLNRIVPVLDLTPVVAAPHLKRRLWNRAPRVLLMSGTFFGSKATLEEIGLEDRPAREIVVRSEFSPENGPIFRVPVAKLNYANKETEFPKILAALGRLLSIEKGRGIVHSQSFANVQAVAQAVPEPERCRLWLHRGGDNFDREEFIRQFKEESEPGAVLVSPSLTEGLDLPGELGEFAVFLKAPFMSINEERVSKRMAMPDGRRWFERKAIEKTIQGRGRILRSKTDRGATYLFDLAHIRLLERWWFDLPEWFTEPMMYGDGALSYETKAFLMGLTTGTTD